MLKESNSYLFNNFAEFEMKRAKDRTANRPTGPFNNSVLFDYRSFSVLYSVHLLQFFGRGAVTCVHFCAQELIIQGVPHHIRSIIAL